MPASFVSTNPATMDYTFAVAATAVLAVARVWVVVAV